MDLKTEWPAEAAGGLCPGLTCRAAAPPPGGRGHWSTLGLLNRPDLLSLDTGCVWGGSLSARCALGADGPSARF